MTCHRFTLSALSATSRPRLRRREATRMTEARTHSLKDQVRARQVVVEPVTVSAQERLRVAEARVAELEAQLAVAMQQANTDALTGALNRRGLCEAFEREMSRAERQGESVALALIDLDDFKRVNDQFGHAVGDDALLHLAAVIRALLRPTDVFARIGGEEFVLLMPGSRLGDALNALSRLQKALTYSTVGNTGLHMSFSAGVTMAAHNETMDVLLERADSAVYAAKGAGKACIRSA